MQDKLTTQQRKLMSEIKDYDIKLSIIEKIIIEKIRTMKYGNITIFIMDGVPQRTSKEESEMLTPESFR